MFQVDFNHKFSFEKYTIFNEKELFSFTIELKFIGKKLSKSLCRIMEKEKLAHFLANNQNFSKKTNNKKQKKNNSK